MRAAHVPSVSFFVRGPHDASGFHPFPSMNDVIAANRSGYGAGNRLKRRLTELVATQCREVMAETGWVAPMGPVEVSFRWHEVWRGRDVDNVMSAQKFVLDGMVEAGMLRGDSQRYVPRPPAHEIVIDREHPGVTVEVTRAQERPRTGRGQDNRKDSTMAIDIRNYRPVTETGRRMGSDRSYYMVTHNNGKGQCRLYLDAVTAVEVETTLGGSVGLSYSGTSGVVVMHAQDYDNSRTVSHSSSRGERSLRGSVSTAFMQGVLERLFGIHRRYYVTVTRDEDLDGNPVFVVAPSGEVA